MERMNARRAELMEAGVKLYLDPLEKARRDPKSMRKAITAKCWDCVGAGADPSPRQEIGRCAVVTCPLWPVRPWQKYSESTPLERL